MTRKDAEVLLQLEVELCKARTKHPDFPRSAGEGVAVIAEELLELNEAMLHLARAANDNYPEEHLIEEAYHVAVTAVRFIQKRIK